MQNSSREHDHTSPEDRPDGAQYQKEDFEADASQVDEGEGHEVVENQDAASGAKSNRVERFLHSFATTIGVVTTHAMDYDGPMETKSVRIVVCA